MYLQYKYKWLWLSVILFTACQQSNPVPQVQQWTTHELVFQAENAYENGYTDVDLWVWFVSEQGDSLLRPGFWDGANLWKVRFAPPEATGTWTWSSHASVSDSGLAGRKGMLQAVPYLGSNQLIRHGLLRMSPGKRNVVHADGTPFLLVGDTPWSLPFRATPEQVNIWAEDRQRKGFNTALLLTLQPDINARGPEARNTEQGFDRAFADLHTEALRLLKPDYFQILDTLIQIILQHEIVPVYAPFAHGYGWKGETAIGPRVAPDEYQRYCRYLVARYGSAPAFWLINLDSHPGRVPGVRPGGQTIEAWDAYQQPTGLHYSPWDDYIAAWAKGDSSCCFHYNRVYQQEPWLDFQWAQTGHDGKHLFHKVAGMYENLPTRASMNGESTYEAMGGGRLGLGWWQGHDAWMQLMHGGTMGVVYGAASLWQWKITADEAGWPEWTNAPLSWKDALQLEGSRYVAYIARAFQGFSFADMEKRWDLTENQQPLLAKEGLFYVAYLPQGGSIQIHQVPTGLPYRWFNPINGTFSKENQTSGTEQFDAPDPSPWVLLIGRKNI